MAVNRYTGVDPEQMDRRALISMMGTPEPERVRTPESSMKPTQSGGRLTAAPMYSTQPGGYSLTGGTLADARSRYGLPDMQGTVMTPDDFKSRNTPISDLITPGTAAGEKPSKEPVLRYDQREGRGFTGWGSARNQMTGFDLNRYERDIISKGPSHPEYAAKKITFAQLASNTPLQPPSNLSSLKEREAWVRQTAENIVNQLRAAGEDVEFDGLDRIRFKDAPQDGWIDIMQNKEWLKTGRGPVLWAWMDNHGSQPSGGAAAAPAFGGDGGSSLANIVPTDADTYRRLQARLQQIIGSPAHDRQALLSLMMQ